MLTTQYFNSKKWYQILLELDVIYNKTKQILLFKFYHLYKFKIHLFLITFDLIFINFFHRILL